MKVRPKKSLGQHFLKDEGISRSIAEALSGHGGYTRLLEIGPGTGALTRHLLNLPAKFELFVVEIDRDSVAYLKAEKTLPEERIIEADFLREDLSDRLGDCYGIAGNFPYNISTQILFKVFDERDHVPEVVGMFQKEVAQRIASPPGNKDYGILSVLLQLFYDIDYLFTVPAEAFDPPPKVLSGVIRLRRNELIEPDCDLKLFVRTVKASFNQRRKMLRVSLRSILPAGSQLSDPFATKRPEQLSSEEFVVLTREVGALLSAANSAADAS